MKRASYREAWTNAGWIDRIAFIGVAALTVYCFLMVYPIDGFFGIFLAVALAAQMRDDATYEKRSTPVEVAEAFRKAHLRTLQYTDRG